ncbi:carbonic anhydrase [Cloacibacterium rupense]|uniref:Carbonic anhydrase n=1 Tax=Cloacibacterium rupense TaxID=517423 RepID=A0ABQ2NHL9_9FLAO|nr:carbonic anhydrase [Cloacibacterium rupense]GGP02734.1 carbonic anhydrase [Cloacibacterium rupense]
MKKVNVGVLMLLGAMLSFSGCSSNQVSQKEVSVQENLGPNQILEVLKAGNDHFVHHKNAFPHLDKARMMEEISGQHPIATIVSCSDSRVPIELVFDRGIGDLFVIRTAGNSLDDDMTMGSLEYAVEHLHTKLIIVVGHEKCGGITAAISNHTDEKELKEISNLIETLRNGVAPFVGKTEKLDEAIHYNVDHQIQKILQNSELKELIEKGELKVVGGYYHLNDGKVDILN